jgi:hypothetical protein
MPCWPRSPRPGGKPVRPVDKIMGHVRNCGLSEPRDQRVGTGEHAFHLLVADRDTAVSVKREGQPPQ